jgi:hypothetical protein
MLIAFTSEMLQILCNFPFLENSFRKFLRIVLHVFDLLLAKPKGLTRRCLIR